MAVTAITDGTCGQQLIATIWLQLHSHCWMCLKNVPRNSLLQFGFKDL